MKIYKRQLFQAILLSFFICGTVSADTCYDPRYGYYDCNPVYSNYPDEGQDLMAGAFFGFFLGAALSDGYNGGGGHWHGGGGGGYHHGGRGGGGGGGHHR